VLTPFAITVAPAPICNPLIIASTTLLPDPELNIIILIILTNIVVKTIILVISMFPIISLYRALKIKLKSNVLNLIIL